MYLCWSDCDGVAGVDTHGVNVLNGADDDHVVCQVAHDLQLILLPAQQRHFNEHLQTQNIRSIMLKRYSHHRQSEHYKRGEGLLPT